jgi:nicotinamide-nucleotide amidase
VIDKAGADGAMVATAESCTGGMIAAALTDVPGSSAVVDRGFVTYSNEAKTEMLAVPPELVAWFGAVSAEVARAMAQGAVLNSRADVAVSVTGVAGPTGGTAESPSASCGSAWRRPAASSGSNDASSASDRVTMCAPKRLRQRYSFCCAASAIARSPYNS